MAQTPTHRHPLPETKLDEDTPSIEMIDNDIATIKVDKWLRKSYALDFGVAHSELTLVMENINESLQRANIACSDAKREAEELAGETLMKTRQGWSSQFEDKMTESTVAAVLAQDKNLIAAWRRYSVLKSWVTRLENMLENVRLKLGAMRSFEATRRKTLDENPD